MSKGRGRPPEVVQRRSGEGLPVGTRVEELQPTTRAILEAARRLLVTDGIKAVTMAGVAREAHVDVTTVSYHFHTREGLIEALLDSLYAEPVADLMEAVRDTSTVEQRWHTYLLAVRTMYGQDDALPGDTAADTQAYFDIAAYALRKPTLKRRLAQLQRWKVDEFARELQAPAIPERDALAEFVFSAIDGIELHQAIAEEDFPLDEVLQLLEDLVLMLLRTRGALDEDLPT